MSYLTKIVGLTGTTPAPTAGVKLVDNLPIISEAFVAGIAKLDTENISTTWQRVVMMAEDRLENDLYAEIMKDDKVRQLMAMTVDFGYISGAVKAASERWEGARIKTARQKNTTLFVKQLYVGVAGTYTVKIFDLNNGLPVYESPEDIVLTGEGYISVNTRLSLDKLNNDYFVAIYANEVNLPPIDGNRGFFGDRCGSYPVTVTSGSIGDIYDKVVANFQGGQCYVHIEAEISSDISNFVSQNTDLFALCAQYLCGSIILNESLTTDRFNIWSNTNRIERQNEAARQEEMYNDLLCKAIQPVLMRMNVTAIVEDKPATEKVGVYKESLVEGYGYFADDYGMANDIPYTQ